MKKYYNKDIPTEIHFVYGGRYAGKTYYEFKKINDILDDLIDDYDRDITLDEINLIKDYITKLQKENNQYKEYIKELKDSLMNYHIKNNKLTSAMKDTYDSANDTCGELQQRIKELEEENKKKQEVIANLLKDNADLQLRINKAIKYLNLKVDLDKNHLLEAINDMQEDLLKILGVE